MANVWVLLERAGMAMAVAGGLIAGGVLASGHLRLAAPALAAATATAVAIDNFSFAPATLTIPVGTTVRWTNHDDDAHTVASADGPKVLSSPPLDTGDSYDFTFAKPGTYRYFCSIHPEMQATIVVQ